MIHLCNHWKSSMSELKQNDVLKGEKGLFSVRHIIQVHYVHTVSLSLFIQECNTLQCKGVER